MRPLEVKIEILTPVGSPLRRQAHPVHLDSLLIALMTIREKRKFDPESPDPFAPGTGKVPLAVVGNKVPIYQSSVGYPGGNLPAEYGYFSFVKKPPNVELQILKARKPEKTKYYQSPSAGQGKGWMESIPVVHPGRYLGFQCVGDKDAITEILDGLQSIGVMRRVGLGEVIKVSVVETDPADPSTWGLLDNNKMPLRELPVVDWPDVSSDCAAGNVAAVPPYWYPGNNTLCWLPKQHGW